MCLTDFDLSVAIFSRRRDGPFTKSREPLAPTIVSSRESLSHLSSDSPSLSPGHGTASGSRSCRATRPSPPRPLPSPLVQAATLFRNPHPDPLLSINQSLPEAALPSPPGGAPPLLSLHPGRKEVQAHLWLHLHPPPTSPWRPLTKRPLARFVEKSGGRLRWRTIRSASGAWGGSPRGCA